ncbi:MAG: response regulator [Propionicimonas sp.]
MTEEQNTARVLLYSDDRAVREQVRLALGKRPAADLPELAVFEVATQPAVLKALDAGGFDLVILDGEATPSGGIGLCFQLKNEIDPCPPVLLLVARVADAWLATWSRADAIVAYPLDPVKLPVAAAELLRAGRSAEATA